MSVLFSIKQSFKTITAPLNLLFFKLNILNLQTIPQITWFLNPLTFLFTHLWAHPYLATLLLKDQLNSSQLWPDKYAKGN